MDGSSAQDVPLEELEHSAVAIFRAMKTALRNDHAAFMACVWRTAQKMSVAADAGADERRPMSSRSVPSTRGGLLPWQMRKVSAYIDSHLDSRIAVSVLAAEIGLSRYHFSREFRRSLGESPHAHVCLRRIQRAQRLMLTTAIPLGQIAVECGLADQPHFNRMFRKVVGESPAAWRRTRRTDC